MGPQLRPGAGAASLAWQRGGSRTSRSAQRRRGPSWKRWLARTSTCSNLRSQTTSSSSGSERAHAFARHLYFLMASRPPPSFTRQPPAPQYVYVPVPAKSDYRRNALIGAVIMAIIAIILVFVGIRRIQSADLSAGSACVTGIKFTGVGFLVGAMAVASATAAWRHVAK